MEEYRVIYRILKAIYEAMDYDEFDFDTISAETLRVSENKRVALLVMIAKRGLIDNVQVLTISGGATGVKFLGRPALTIEGLEYLQENSMMQKAARAAKGIAMAEGGE